MLSSPVSLLIFISTLGISLYAMYGNQSLFYRWMLRPYAVAHEGKWYQIITSGFIHADLWHLLFNMLAFYFFAFPLEGAFLHPLEFLLIYFGSMALADVSTILKHKDNPDYASVGASGAIAGILFSSILYMPYGSIMIFPIPFGIPAPIFGILFLVYSYYIGRKVESFVNHEAHFWGALSGVAITIILDPSVIPHFFSYIF